MKNSNSTLIVNKSAIFKDTKRLNLRSLNQEQLSSIIPEEVFNQSTKGEKQKKISSLFAEDKDKAVKKKAPNTVKFSSHIRSFNTEIKENKYSFLKELELDSVHRSNLQDSKSSLDKSSIIKVYEELADIKHQHSKLQNENKVNK